ncbi:hypothetical protein BZL29_3394 [Mycobacterium kansasii]|uniref:Uncharacterized protein n=1 Tax=Mycobacterium kansasii TaxID=1768 RepID=A0A1V3XEW3_MYCKA|nr:hypothetical protein BZL29_3394 [Mycobacterium kansasii]
MKWLPTSYSDDPFDRLAVGNAATSGGGHLEVDTHGAVRSPRQRRTFRRGADPSATRSSEIPRPAAGPDSAITTAATRGSERMVLKRLTGRHQRVTLQRGLAGLAGEIGYFSSRDTPVSNYAPIAFASCWGQ